MLLNMNHYWIHIGLKAVKRIDFPPCNSLGLSGTARTGNWCKKHKTSFFKRGGIPNISWFVGICKFQSFKQLLCWWLDHLKKNIKFLFKIYLCRIRNSRTHPGSFLREITAWRVAGAEIPWNAIRKMGWWKERWDFGFLCSSIWTHRKIKWIFLSGVCWPQSTSVNAGEEVARPGMCDVSWAIPASQNPGIFGVKMILKLIPLHSCHVQGHLPCPRLPQEKL